MKKIVIINTDMINMAENDIRAVQSFLGGGYLVISGSINQKDCPIIQVFELEGMKQGEMKVENNQLGKFSLTMNKKASNLSEYPVCIACGMKIEGFSHACTFPPTGL